MKLLAFVFALAAASASTSLAWAGDDVARGAYIVIAVAACAGCHAGEAPGASLSGGRKFGTGPTAIVAPNITPDRETGIGAWSDAQIHAAMLKGSRPDGSRIGPPMPQVAYRAMRDEDVRAIIAYLRTLPPVHHVVPRSQRPGTPSPTNAPPATVAGNDSVAPGRYIANALAHCTECHTPGPPYAPDFASRLDAGGRTFSTPAGPLLAPSITPSSLRRFSDAELTDLITKGERPDGTRLTGPMPVRSYAEMTTNDVKAIIAFLRVETRRNSR